jgi:hypothetical protein
MNADLRKIDRSRSSLEIVLLLWAVEFWPEPIDAIIEKWGDWEFERRCIGSIFRRVVRMNRPYFYKVAEAVPRELLALAPYIREVEMEFGTMPGKLGWAGWLKALDDCSAF